MKRAHYKDVRLDPLNLEGFINFSIGSFTHFSDAPINCSVLIIRLEDGATPYHNHQHTNQHELDLVLSGRGILKTDEKEEEVREGDVMYFSPKDNHQLESLGGSIVVASVHINSM